MPDHVALQKRSSVSSKSGVSDEIEQQESEQSEQQTDHEALMKRLKAQGAVRVFPFAGPGSKSQPSGSGAKGAEEEQDEREAQEESPGAEQAEREPEALPPVAEEVEAGEAEGQDDVDFGPDWDLPQGRERSGGRFRDTNMQEDLRVQQSVDAANNPKWYDLPQRIENERHGPWDLSKSRDRSGGRKQDTNLEEDVRTNKVLNQMNPGLLDVGQRAKNAFNDAADNPAATAAGMVPVAGAALKQAIKERPDVRERDMLRGVAATQSSDDVRESAGSQAQALSTKINNDRFKVGVGTVTGAVGKAVPGSGLIGSAVGAAAGVAADKVNGGALKQVQETRAREKARKDMGKAEFAGYDGVEEAMVLEKIRKQLEAAGEGDEDSGAPSEVSEDMLKRLKAHTRGEVPNAKLFQERAKQHEKEREAERQRGMEPKPKEESGFFSKLKKRVGF